MRFFSSWLCFYACQTHLLSHLVVVANMVWTDRMLVAGILLHHVWLGQGERHKVIINIDIIFCKATLKQAVPLFHFQEKVTASRLLELDCEYNCCFCLTYFTNVTKALFSLYVPLKIPNATNQLRLQNLKCLCQIKKDIQNVY